MTPELVTHMTALAKDADKHDKKCQDADNGCCMSNRWFTVACLMDHLGLNLADLGYIAEAWMGLQFEDVANDVADDQVLDAKEIGE